MLAGLIALVVAASTAPAAPPAPPPAAAPGPSSRGAAALKALGMSDPGIQVLRTQSQPDPDLRALMAKRQALRARLNTTIAATPFNVDAVAAAMREISTMEQTLRSRSEERIVTTLKALPAADRPIFAKAVFGASQRPAEAPTAAPPSP